MSSKLHAALEFAVKAHAGQDRDGAAAPPYVCHPIEVMQNLRYVGGVEDEELLTVALFHDTLEESSTKLEQIKKGFGDRVAALVMELTRHEPTAEQTAGLSKDEVWKLRSEMLLAEIERMSEDAQQVKLADRLSNLREAKITKPKLKYKRYRAQTEHILDIVPRKRNRGLWEAIRAELPK